MTREAMDRVRDMQDMLYEKYGLAGREAILVNLVPLLSEQEYRLLREIMEAAKISWRWDIDRKARNSD